MELLEKYADIIVNIGVHINEGQLLVVNSPVECAPLTRLIVKKAYEAKASYVMVRWSDDIVNHEYYLHAADEAIDEVPDWIVDQFHFIVDKGAAVVSITSPSPVVINIFAMWHLLSFLLSIIYNILILLTIIFTYSHSFLSLHIIC